MSARGRAQRVGAAGGGGGGGGTTDHAALTNRSWTLSGHTGSGVGVAGFDSGSAAVLYSIDTAGGLLTVNTAASTYLTHAQVLARASLRL